MLKYKLLIFLTLTGSLSSFAKVDPPNYDFSLDSLKIFYPGQTLKKVIEKYPKAKVVQKDKGFLVYKLYVAHIRYKFPVLVQARGEVVTDFYARLPAYFLHDVFHQSLINRLGNQDKYHKKEEAAVYIWNNKAGLRHVYSGACSITCFPVFYSVYPIKGQTGGYKPLLKSMN